MYKYEHFQTWDEVMYFINNELQTNIIHTKIVPCHEGGYYVVH